MLGTFTAKRFYTISLIDFSASIAIKIYFPLFDRGEKNLAKVARRINFQTYDWIYVYRWIKSNLAVSFLRPNTFRVFFNLDTKLGLNKFRWIW